MPNKFYPALSTLIAADHLPEGLNFVVDSINTLLDHIYFKDIIIEKSHDGSLYTCVVDIVSYSQLLKIEIPGTGLVLKLNPDLENPSNDISVIPVYVGFKWGILQFFKDFKLSSFSFQPDAFHKFFSTVAGSPTISLVSAAIELFSITDDPSTEFVEKLNIIYPQLNISVPVGVNTDTAAVAVLNAFNNHPELNLYTYLFDNYITDNDSALSLNNLDQLFFPLLGLDASFSFKKIIVPHINAALRLSAALEIPRTALIPIKPDGSVETNPAINVELLFDIGDLRFSTDNGLRFDSALSISFPTAYPKAQIGNTGLIIGFNNAKLDTSTTTNIAEADAAGYPVDFVGLYVQQAEITLAKFGQDNTEKVSASIIGSNLLIGTGGVSGTISLVDNGLLFRKFGNFEAELNVFSATFLHGSIIDSIISGKITLPEGFNNNGVPSEILIDASIRDNGDFIVSARVLGTLPSFTFPGVFTVSIRSLAVGEIGGRFFVKVAGILDFIADVPGLGQVLPKGIVIKKLIIWDNGDFEFEGGALTLTQTFSIKIGPVKIEVANISLGSYSRKHNGIDRSYYFFGFDGMVNTGNAGVEAYGNGIKYYFTHDNNSTNKPFDHFISVDGIGIDITIPGNVPPEEAAVVLSGYLSVKNPDPAITGSSAGTEYTGKVAFSIPPLNMRGSAAMRLDPSIPAFVVDIGLELATAIPLGSTGLGIYDFRGLIGVHYVPSKSATTPPLPESATWWEYYKAKSTLTHAEGIEIDKFASKSGFSLGAGVSIATDLADSGFIFSSKLFLLLGLPEVFLIQGQATIISDRLGLFEEVDPPFSALIVLSRQSILGNVNVDFNLPSSGSSKGFILALQASLDMGFFYNNLSAWYLNIGKDTPDTAQVRARILDIFEGHAYLMLSSQGIKAGAGISFNFNKSFGPVGVGLGAFLNMGGFISFKPVQIGAFIQVGGYAYIKVFKFKFGLSVAVALAVEAPNPFNIIGSLQIKLNLPWPLKDIKFTLELSWRINNNKGPLLEPIAVLNLPDPDGGYTPAVATNILTNEIFPINYITIDNPGEIPPPGNSFWKYDFTNEDAAGHVTIPLDSFIDIELLKPVKPGNILGGSGNQIPQGYQEMVPPQKAPSGQVKHQYELADLKLYAWNSTSNTWVEYQVYEAVTAIVAANTGTNAINLTELKPGYWQVTEKGKFSKIRLLSQNMFSYLNSTMMSSTDLSGFNYQPGEVLCKNSIDKSKYLDPSVQIKESGLLSYSFQPANNNEINLDIQGNNGQLLLIFKEPAGFVQLDFGPNDNHVTIDFISLISTPADFGQSESNEEIINSQTLIPASGNNTITYGDSNISIDEVRLSFNTLTAPNYQGDIIIGGHYPLPGQLNVGTLEKDLELERALLNVAWYNKSFSESEVLALNINDLSNKVAGWWMGSIYSDAGNWTAITYGSPGSRDGFYYAYQIEERFSVLSFESLNDAVAVPFDPLLQVENASFSFEATAIFEPFTPGVATLVTKVFTDSVTGYQRGYTLHLLQDTPALVDEVYASEQDVPKVSFLLTVYYNNSSYFIRIDETYTVDCDSSKVINNQYKHIFVSVDRSQAKLDIYIDKILKWTGPIPGELAVYQQPQLHTLLKKLTYVGKRDYTSINDNQVSSEVFDNEIRILNNSLNKTIQPVWRPDTTYAVKVTTQDVVDGQLRPGSTKTAIFGFKTAGPIGHFHQHNSIYKALEQQDQANAFKLANLQFYIDYNRSYPDAQSRFDLSKPVFWHDPQVKLFFNQPYLNAMFSNWDSYQGLTALSYRLEVQLLDPSGAAVTQYLDWENNTQTITIDNTNYKSLPPDLQTIYLFNEGAAANDCQSSPITLKKELKQGSYHFPDLKPNKLYTALFNSVHQIDVDTADKAEVYRFNFLTSRYSSFTEQAASYILDATTGSERYAISTQTVSFTEDYISQVLTNLVDDNPDNDPALVTQYAVKYERLVYGGLQLQAPEQSGYTQIKLIVNTDLGGTLKRLIGIWIYNPEPFNDPKLLAEIREGTAKLTLKDTGDVVSAPDSFIYIWSRDNSAVFITNSALLMSTGTMQLSLRNKVFNGIDYETEYTDHIGPEIHLNAFLT